MLVETILEKHKDEDERSQVAKVTNNVIVALQGFALVQMFVLNTRDAGMLALDALPFPFRVIADEKITGGGALLPMRGAQTIPERIYGPVHTAIENMNIVLNQRASSALCPSFTS